jgi:hypothetical protein
MAEHRKSVMEVEMVTRSFLMAGLASASMGISLLLPVGPARANDTGAVVAGAIGGLAAGAVIGGALSQPRYYEPAYPVEPAFSEEYAPPPASYYSSCHQVRQPIYDEYGDIEGYRVVRRCGW